MTKDWKRLASAVRDARKRHSPPLRQEDLADLAGVAVASIQTLERGNGYTRMPRAAYQVAQVLGWTSESIDDVLAGGDPTYRTAETQGSHAKGGDPAQQDPAARLPLAVRDALAVGEVVDTEVLDLGPDDSGMRMIVVVTREERTQEDLDEMRAQLAQWAKTKGELRRLAADPE